MSEIRTIGESIDLSRIREVTGGAQQDVEDALAAIDVKLNPETSDEKVITLKVSRVGVQQIDALARAWRISRSSLIRLCIDRVATEFGFVCGAALARQDIVFVNRSPASRRPFTPKDHQKPPVEESP